MFGYKTYFPIRIGMVKDVVVALGDVPAVVDVLSAVVDEISVVVFIVFADGTVTPLDGDKVTVDVFPTVVDIVTTGDPVTAPVVDVLEAVEAFVDVGISSQID